ncbi:MAG: hypothetical protein LBR88_09135 [Zoogloeaceae bacterium]|jgi:hypothetical protein|nr:hypothetical protein [Zoogloeaceae bacterium]
MNLPIELDGHVQFALVAHVFRHNVQPLRGETGVEREENFPDTLDKPSGSSHRRLQPCRETPEIMRRLQDNINYM